MFVTTAKRQSPRGKITVVRLVHGYREDGRSKMKIIKTIGQSRDLEEIEYFRKLGEALKKELESGIKSNPIPPPPQKLKLGKKRKNFKGYTYCTNKTDLFNKIKDNHKKW